MKKVCILVLCVLCIAAAPLCGGAESKFVLNDFICSKQFPTTYQAFLSEMPAFPTAELISGGCMIRGLEAWGVTRDNMVRWNLAQGEQASGTDWFKHPEVQYEDGAEFLYELEEKPQPGEGMNFRLVNPCEMYDEIAVGVTLNPISPEEGYAGQVHSVEMKKGDVSLTCFSNGSFEYTMDPFDRRNEYGFYAFYSAAGELLSLTYFVDGNDRSGWLRAERNTDPMTDEAVYTVTLTDGSRTDPDNLPFELVPAARMISPEPKEDAVAADPDRMNALNDFSREKAVRRSWPLKGKLPDALPEVSAEQIGDKTVYTVRNMRDWGIGTELGNTYVRKNPETFETYRVPSLDWIPSDQIRIITPLEANEYTLWFRTDETALNGMEMYGWAVFSEETKKQERVYTWLRQTLKDGSMVVSEYDSASKETDNQLVYTTEDGWEIEAYYRGDLLQLYIVRDYSSEDRFFAWTVRFDEADGDSSGSYDTLYFSSKSEDRVEQYKLNREEGQWYTHSYDENFVPEPCDPPDILQYCPMLPVVD